MKDDFEKLDEWMMNAAKAPREQKIPQKDLDTFQEGVIRKIMSRRAAAEGIGVPAPAMSFAMALGFAIVLGSVIFIIHAHVTKPAPAPEETETKKTEIVSQAPAPVAMPQPVLPVVAPQTPKPAASVMQAPTKEAEIIEEIQALKELGAWNEEDEEEVGIPAETSFADLEVYSDNQPGMAGVPVQSQAG